MELSRNSAHNRLVGFFACSGAVITDLFNPFKDQDAQVDLVADLERVDVVTLTIGGNDAGFASVLESCVKYRCSSQLDDAMDDIRALETRLTNTYARVERMTDARDSVVGYPRLFPDLHSETTGCGWLEPRERHQLNRAAKLLDSTIRRAASAAGVRYVSVFDSLDGHELCSEDSWIFPLGLRGGSNMGHPTELGQEAIYQLVAEKLG